MYYFVTAHLAPNKDRQTQFYPEEEEEMMAWMKSYYEFGWTVTVRPMNINQKEKK